MKTFFEVKSQLRADMLMEHFVENLKISTVELIPGNIYQFLPKEKKVILVVDMDDVSYLIDERAFFCLEFDDEYHWKYKAKNTETWGRILGQDIDGLLHRTCDDIFIKPNMMLVDADRVKYMVLEDINKDYVYYNLSTKEYQYTFDKDIVAIYSPHDPEINARRLVWREKEKEVSIEELVKCYAQKHNFDPKNIIVI
jgi:hypothetical protein